GRPLRSFGPLDAAGAFAEIRRALIQGGAVFGIALGLTARTWSGPGTPAVLAIAVMTADLAAANARLVVTVRQKVFDEAPELERVLEAAERDDPASGPFRVHRTPLWEPLAWSRTTSPDRVRAFVRWERGTLQSKYGVPLGISYTLSPGVA